MKYSIGEISKMFNLSVHTIRYYEKEAIISPVKRAKNGIRYFDDNNIESIRLVECLKKTGLSLREIKKFQEYLLIGDDSLVDRFKMYQIRKIKIKEKIKELENLYKVVDFKCDYYEKAISIGSEKKAQSLFDIDKYHELLKECNI